MVGNENFWSWRLALQSLAGPATEEVFYNRIYGQYSNDIQNAVDEIKEHIPASDQRDWLMKCAAGIALTIYKPIVQKTIVEIAKLLLQQGSVSANLICEIVDRRIVRSPKYPAFIHVFRQANERLYQAMRFSNWRDEETRQKYIKELEEANKLFQNDLFRFLNGNAVGLGRELSKHLANEHYWKSEIIPSIFSPEGKAVFNLSGLGTLK